ncbi:MAG: hypothetical protein ACXVXP_00515 [Mycobacteriaceae bacterium]
MSDLLSAAGLAPAPEEPATPAVDATPEPPEAPEPAPAPEADEEVVVPEGAEKPDAVKALIQAERKKARDAYARAKQLEREMAERAEAEKPIEERLSGAEQRARNAELAALRLEVGVERGLTLTLSRRLAGLTREEIEADAKALADELKVTPTAGVSLSGGFQQNPPQETDPNKAHNAFLAGLLSGRQSQ